MSALNISRLSTVYVQVPVSATKSGQPFNPTGDAVQMAFTASGTAPGSSDWQAASWDATSGSPVTYLAQCLVGPSGTVALQPGNYVIWVKITDSPEVPVIPGPALTVS